MNKVSVQFKRCATDAILPVYATAGAAGMDISAFISSPIKIAPLERVAIRTGFAMQLPHGYEAQIRSRSGLVLNHGVSVANAPGTIDSDYRGEVAVILINLGQNDFTITSGMRIAQMIIAPVVQCSINEQTKLDVSERGIDGFGSTGLRGLDVK